MKRCLRWIGVFAILIGLSAISAGAPPVIYATPPSSVKIVYDTEKNLLSVTIIHRTDALEEHFIQFVEIKKNGSVVSINSYKSQPEKIMFTYQYKIKAVEDDMIQVVATCNQGQSRVSDALVIAP